MTRERKGYGQPLPINVRENVTADEYTHALGHLKTFSEADLSHIKTLSELSESTQGVGAALRAVALTKGAFNQGFSYYIDESKGGLWPAYRLADHRGDTNITLTLTNIDTPQEFAIIAAHPLFTHTTDPKLISYIVSQKGRGVYVFTDRIIDKVGPYLALQQLKAYEEIDGRRVYYHPISKPRPSHFQGYARVLQGCVEDLLSLNLPGPEKVPEVFYR